MLVLMLVVGAGTALRLLHLGHSLRVDELDIWAHSQRSLWEIATGQDRLPHAPLLCRLAEGVLGRGEFFLRLPFALYGVLTLPLVFLTGRELFDDEVGLLAALLLAVSSFHIGLCQELRYYAPFTFYSLSALYCLVRLFRREDAAGSARWRACLAAFLLSHLLNLYLHRMAVYPFVLSAVLIVWDIILRRRGGAPPDARDWGPALSMTLLFTVIVASQWQWLRDAVIRESSGALSLRMSYLTWHDRDPRASVAWELLSAYSGGPRAALILLAAGVGGLARGRAGWRPTAPLLLWIVVPLVSLAVVRARTHFELRYFVFLLPVWLLWAASGLSAAASFLGARLSLGGGARRWALLGTAAAVVALGTPSLADYHRLPKARMREAFDFMNASCSDGDAVVMYPEWDTLRYGYYRLKEGCRLFHLENLDGVMATPRRIWLAATWAVDPTGAEEFQRIRGFLSRRCEPEGERLFRSRDPNDDYRVSSFLCRGEGSPPRRAPAPAAAAVPPPSFWTEARYRLLTNIPQAMSRRARCEISKDLSLVSGKAGLVDAGSRGMILFVWNGEGTLAVSGGREGFAAGDVFFLPGRSALRWQSGSSSDAVMLKVALPGRAEGSRSVPRRLGNALDAGFAQAETVLLRGSGWRLVVYRLAPGARQTVGPDSQPPMSRMLSVLLRGRLRFRLGGIDAYVFPGDLFTAERIGTLRSGRLEHPGPEDSAELRVIMEGASSTLIAPVTYSIEKRSLAAWPPMQVP